MAERVDVPPDFRADSEFIKEELMTQSHLVDHIAVPHCRFVVLEISENHLRIYHAPSTIDEF